MDISARYIDTCLPCYLTDSYSREGQMLCFAGLGDTKEGTVDQLLDSIDDDVTVHTIEDIESVLATAIEGVDLRYRDEDGNPCDKRSENVLDDEPLLFVLLEW